MFLWISIVITLLLLQTSIAQAQQANSDNRPVAVEEVAGTTEPIPTPLVFPKNDWYLNQAYSDVFKILSNPNSCSNFYGGPRVATTVLNDLMPHVKPVPLFREVSFQMSGRSRLIRDHSAGVLYRLFDMTTVNTTGSFYQRRVDHLRNVPGDVGQFLPGSRAARALILLHELAHLIEGENGEWLIPDDGHNFGQSKANTLRVQEVCRAELKKLN